MLTTPRAEIGPLYYMSKINVYNFTIFELSSQLGYCHVWNKTLASRGSKEIASLLWLFISKKVESGVTEICLYSDNCGGQNHNKNIFSMLFRAANQHKINIVHRFLEVGHTQRDGDSMYARMRLIRRTNQYFLRIQGEIHERV